MARPNNRPVPGKHQSRNAAGPKKTSADDPLVWGIHPVMELISLKSSAVKEIILNAPPSSEKIQQIVSLAGQQKIPVLIKEQSELFTENKRMNHQGVIARIWPMETLSLDSIIHETTKPHASKILLALDSIQDPHNLGAIIRSATAAGVDGIIIPKDRSAPLSGATVKVSAGAIVHSKICQVTNLPSTLQILKKQGFWIFGADKSDQQSIYQTDFSGPVCLVMGGEEKGIRPLVKEQCDFLITIPMAGPVESLNASVATAIILFEIIRQKSAHIA